MRSKDFFLTFETENDKDAETIMDLYIQIQKAIGKDRVAYGLTHKKEDVLDDNRKLKSVRLTGKRIHRIDVYKDEHMDRRPKKSRNSE